MKRVFICSPYRDSDPIKQQENVRMARRVCKQAVREGASPFAPHLFYPQFLDEKSGRDLGLKYGKEALKFADEVWVVGSRITEGMAEEIARASQLGIPTRCVMDPKVAEEKLLDAVMRQ